MSRDPTNNSVLQFKKRKKALAPANLAEQLLLPTPLEPDAGEPLPRGKKLYGQVPIRWLFDPVLRDLIPPAMRLYLYLQIKSRRGARTVRLTSDVAAAADYFDRSGKAKALRRLERDGLISVARNGNRLPVVTVRRFASLDYE